MIERILKLLRTPTRAIAARISLDKWNYWLGRIHEVKLIGRVKPFTAPTTGCSANINIVVELAQECLPLEGELAECGVFHAATLSSLSWWLDRQDTDKMLFGFDSFEGFEPGEMQRDMERGAADEIGREAALFSDNSLRLVQEKLNLCGTGKRVQLVPGFFNSSLPNFADHRFSFVHLDCDLYEPYRQCLEFFYPRMPEGGIILFDEYRDPVYEGCSRAVDDFLSDKPEIPIEIIRDNYQKYFIRKGSAE